MLGDAVRKGTRQEALEALRDFYADLLDGDISGRDAASVGRRLETVLAELDELKESDDDGDLGDELERRRLGREKRLA